MKTILKIVFLLLGIASALILFKEQINRPDTVGKIIANQFEDDMHFLKERKFLPPMWDNLKEVQFTSTNPMTVQWLNEAQPQIATKPNGQFKLEYVLMDDKDAAMVQLNITDTVSGNKVWELSRVYSVTEGSLENSPESITE